MEETGGGVKKNMGFLKISNWIALRENLADQIRSNNL
jgi:hypothetical protein